MDLRQPPSSLSGSLLAAAEAAKLRAYQDGMKDGIKMMLDQIQADPAALAPEGQYHGPMPDELRDWLAGVRRRL